jgi:hypothetical protein
MPERNDNPKEFLPEPTEEELRAIIANSKLSVEFKAELLDQYAADAWIPRQLTRIYKKIDEVHNRGNKNDQEVKWLWEALNNDWKARRETDIEYRNFKGTL